MVAVFERIDLSLLEEILASAAGESSLQMVSFTNQPPGKGHSVPDARISARFSYWFEVKTSRNVLSADQLTEHLANLGGDGDERLFVITPDPEQPSVVQDLGDRRVVWFNFRSLFDAIEGVTNDPAGSVAEQTRFLLRELQALLVHDGLVDTDDVVVVAARFAYPEYLKQAAYICQAERPFRYGLTHLGFYSNGAIQAHVPRIRHREDLVAFTKTEAAARKLGADTDKAVGAVIEDALITGSREEGEQYQVFLLSKPADHDTVQLPRPITNDTVDKSGKPCAWTMGQRYVNLAGLTRPSVRVTSDLAKP